jgi:hypothetical protein
MLLLLLLLLLLPAYAELYLDEHVDEWQDNCEQDVCQRNAQEDLLGQRVDLQTCRNSRQHA